jgi:glycosyltransferase involved in cell wall biosynthesis
MKKIIYLTNAMHYNDYEKLLKYVDKMPNPSNQNFHYRFIKNLEEHYKVKVISQRPVNHHNCGLPAMLYEMNHNFFYPGFSLNPLLRHFELYKSSKDIVKSLKITKDDTVFVDLLNRTLVRLAKWIKQKYKTKVIGILTDSPHNLSNVKESYIKKVEENFKICDGFVTLTEELNAYANKKLKPYTMINGVLSYTNINPTGEKLGKYMYFAGALYSRYGVMDLIEAFIKIKTDWHLLIAGHGPLKDEIMHLADSHPRIDFLGEISPYKSLMYAKEAMVLVNPRPYNESLDRYSIPSKVIEYANTGRLVVSTKHSQLEKVYGDSVVWTGDRVEELKATLEKVIQNYEKFAPLGLKAKERGEEVYGKKVLNKKIDELLTKIEME